jgi:hypothetical protein
MKGRDRIDGAEVNATKMDQAWFQKQREKDLSNHGGPFAQFNITTPTGEVKQYNRIAALIADVRNAIDLATVRINELESIVQNAFRN